MYKIIILQISLKLESLALASNPTPQLKICYAIPGHFFDNSCHLIGLWEKKRENKNKNKNKTKQNKTKQKPAYTR